MRYQHVIRAILSRPWAIDPESLAWAAVLDVLSLRASGERLSDEEIAARKSRATDSAVVPPEVRAIASAFGERTP